MRAVYSLVVRRQRHTALSHHVAGRPRTSEGGTGRSCGKSMKVATLPPLCRGMITGSITSPRGVIIFIECHA